MQGRGMIGVTVVVSNAGPILGEGKPAQTCGCVPRSAVGRKRFVAKRDWAWIPDRAKERCNRGLRAYEASHDNFCGITVETSAWRESAGAKGLSFYAHGRSMDATDSRLRLPYSTRGPVVDVRKSITFVMGTGNVPATYREMIVIGIDGGQKGSSHSDPVFLTASSWLK